MDQLAKAHWQALDNNRSAPKSWGGKSTAVCHQSTTADNRLGHRAATSSNWTTDNGRNGAHHIVRDRLPKKRNSSIEGK